MIQRAERVASCRFTTGVIRVEPDRHHVSLPRLGRIKTHESTRKLARRIEGGSARILSATVRQDAGRWFVSFTCEVQRSDPAPTRPDAVVWTWASRTWQSCPSRWPVSPMRPGSWPTPDTCTAPDAPCGAPRAGCPAAGAPDRRTGQRASHRWHKANRVRNTVHHRIRNLRRDGLHKLTTGLAATAGTVVIENLNVAGMLRNRRLARAIADAGFAEIRRQLDYKTRWRGGRLHVADRWFPSSKTCSDCGVVKPKLPLHIRVFRCEDCGLALDRDLNAARNLAALAAGTGTGVAGDLEPHGSNGRGADRKTPPSGAGGHEASTPHRFAGQDGDRPLATAGCT